MNLIKLDYAVLSMLANNELSGYDITHSLKEIWKTTHSRIYPVLAKLEKYDLVQHRHIIQTNKPDKKMFSITLKGIEFLKKWLISKTSIPVRKDEGLLKVMCMHLLDVDERIKMLHEWMEEVKKEKERLEKIFLKIKDKAAGKVTDTGNPFFAAHIVNEGMKTIVGIHIAFGDWLMELLRKTNVDDYYLFKFKDYLYERFIK